MGAMTSRLPPSSITPLPPWQASLQLGFTRSGTRTVLSDNRHSGPLRVQKALYPEGETVCQTILLHPPSGIAGGDQLRIDATAEAGAHAQLTTPGAGKWYRSSGLHASQQVNLRVDAGATLEWLPQENIVFNGARADMTTHVALAADSSFIGWDILCLGRAAAGERFTDGQVALACRVTREDRVLWLERGRFDGDDPMLASPVGWAGATVSGTLLCTYPALAQEAPPLLDTLRTCSPNGPARYGITMLPGLLIARYLGDSSESARHWLTELWTHLRPACCGRPARPPRIWNT